MTEGTSVPWKWVAGTAVSLLITVLGAATWYVISSQAEQIKELKTDIGKLQASHPTIAVIQTEQTNLRRRVERLENDAVNLLERVLKEERERILSDVHRPKPRASLQKLEKRIKLLRSLGKKP